MRLLKTLLLAAVVAVALTAGLVATAVVALIGVVIYFVRRLLRSPAPPRPAVPGARPPGPSTRAGGEVIDVTATEIR